MSGAQASVQMGRKTGRSWIPSVEIPQAAQGVGWGWSGEEGWEGGRQSPQPLPNSLDLPGTLLVP